jgi:hypothetical protein
VEEMKMRSTLNLILSGFLIAATGCNAVRPTAAEPTAEAQGLRTCDDSAVDAKATFGSTGSATVRSTDAKAAHVACKNGMFEDRFAAQIDRTRADVQAAPRASYHVVVEPADPLLNFEECHLTTVDAAVSVWRAPSGDQVVGSWQSAESKRVEGAWVADNARPDGFCLIALKFDTALHSSATPTDGNQPAVLVKAKVVTAPSLPGQWVSKRDLQITVSEQRVGRFDLDRLTNNRVPAGLGDSRLTDLRDPKDVPPGRADEPQAVVDSHLSEQRAQPDPTVPDELKQLPEKHLTDEPVVGPEVSGAAQGEF